MTVQHHQSAAGLLGRPAAPLELIVPERVALPDLAARRAGPYEQWVKPLVDRLAGAILLVVMLPVMGLVAIGVLLALGRPVLLRQRRVGRGGRTFGMWKFRTMLPDRRAEQCGPWDGVDRRVTHKSKDDPRLVPLGRFLRRWSLDELPQLLNVAAGDMSLVGPRPELLGIVEGYKEWQHARHLVKPGVTGLWQVSERGNGLMHERTDVDLDYIAGLSALTDLRILLMTVPCALGLRRGF